MKPYGGVKKSIKRRINNSFNKKFYVKADIADFFPSIYSHAIQWALVSLDKAKREKSEKWFNDIDYFQRLGNRKETNGIPVGPATSNVLSEIILAKVDERLDKKFDFDFYRIIDDYQAFCETREKAEKFIRVLKNQLSNFKLRLNIKKTSIKQLPVPIESEWFIDVVNHLPSKDNREPINITRFMDYALQKQEHTPDGSVLKYAAKSIKNDLSVDSADLLLKYLLDLCMDYPVLLPILEDLFDQVFERSGTIPAEYFEQLNHILLEHAINKRSDAMAWSLYYLNEFSQSITENIAEKVVDSEDCIAILMLYLQGEYKVKAINFAKSLLAENDLFLLDRYWILLYQMYFEDEISHPYGDKDLYAQKHCKSNDKPKNVRNREIRIFKVMKEDDVSFVDFS